ASITRTYGGTGLGLVITQRFCRRMGGDVTVTSAAGEGSVFTIRLPAQVVDPPAEGEPAAQAPAAVAGSNRTPLLVIDDDPTVHDLVRRFLAREPFVVESAFSGEEGLRRARELHPAVITLDVMMPHMDGWTVLSELKKDPQIARIPVIMVTIVDDRGMGFTLGAVEYLTKPLDRTRLVTVLNKYRRTPQDHTALVVEDDPSSRELLRRMLEKEGWGVTEAENGRQALTSVTETVPDLILLDLLMPEMDGFEFIRELRARKEWRSVPVIVVTAKQLDSDDRGQLHGQVQQVFQKGGYTRDELLIELQELVREHVPGKLNTP
ncbi:MAG: domain S-box, partial [Armatimonadetes bacterium]|nr:domain S-box [Armatimonadota bacterium]